MREATLALRPMDVLVPLLDHYAGPPHSKSRHRSEPRSRGRRRGRSAHSACAALQRCRLCRRRWNGVFAPLRDVATFAHVRVDSRAGTIVWPSGADMAWRRCAGRPKSTRQPGPSQSLDFDPDVLDGDYPPDRPGLHDLDARAVG